MGVVASARDAQFEGIYDSELSYVWSTLRRLGVPPRDLEDVAHDVFLVVHTKLDEFDATRAVRPWIFGVAFRVAVSYRRKRSNSHEVLGESVETVDPSIELSLRAREAREVVEHALHKIDIDRRAVFVMHELDGFAIPQIARELELPVNTAYSRLRLAREEFTEAVQRLSTKGGPP